jgi:hypothetical protein
MNGAHHEYVMGARRVKNQPGAQAKKNAAEAAFKLGDPSMKSHFSHFEA